jgi:ribosomal protein S18 acetylase RimI-like enzyme
MRENYRIRRPTGLFEEIEIRYLRKSDLSALEWEGEFIHFRNVYADLYQKIEKGTAKAWVAYNTENQLIGQIFLQLISDRLELADGWNRAYMYSFRIRPSYQGNGLGTRMLSILEKEVIGLRYTRLTLNVACDNHRAIKLYKRCGYQIVADEPGIWTFPDHNNIWQTIVEPAWRMEKRLVSR